MILKKSKRKARRYGNKNKVQNCKDLAFNLSNKDHYIKQFRFAYQYDQNVSVNPANICNTHCPAYCKAY